MSRHDETDGWIFSSEAHDWLDARSMGNYVGTRYRVGRGLYSVKEDVCLCIPGDDKELVKYEYCGTGEPGARFDAEGPHQFIAWMYLKTGIYYTQYKDDAELAQYIVQNPNWFYNYHIQAARKVLYNGVHDDDELISMA